MLEYELAKERKERKDKNIEINPDEDMFKDLEYLIKEENLKFLEESAKNNIKKMKDFEMPSEKIENLYNIGTKPDNFEEIKSNNNKPYTILGVEIFGYVDYMLSKKYHLKMIY